MVGLVKRGAVMACRAPILVELDHDDLLTPDALRLVYRAFKDHPEASFVYSSFTHIDEDGEAHTLQFAKEYGWQYSIIEEDDENAFLVPNVMAPTPHNVSQIWYAPNHLRAFTREAYDKTRGYDPDLEVLDDLDLMYKLYRVGEFIPIDKMLYKQRLHKNNTQLKAKLNQKIQDGTMEMYEEHIQDMAIVWSQRNNLRALKEASLDDINEIRWARADKTHGLIRTLELGKAARPELVMDIVHQALAPNGMFLSMTPYWGQDFFDQYTIGPDRKFQVSRQRCVWYDDIPYFQANLIAIKEGYVREGGLLS